VSSARKNGGTEITVYLQAQRTRVGMPISIAGGTTTGSLDFFFSSPLGLGELIDHAG
jgi:hypothetical protein